MIQIYPTLIDSYYYFLGSEMTTDEMIARINRVKTPTTPSQMQGTAFNNLIDAMITGTVPEIRTLIKKDGSNELVYAWKHDQSDYTFSKSVVDEIAGYLQGATSQVYSKAPIKTAFGDVLLYGYADYIRRDKLFELKTTSRYEFPKFSTAFQHKCYLYTMNTSGNDVKLFDYLVTDLKNVYVETYNWHEGMEKEIITQLNRFLGFLFDNECKITDRKIFGGENPVNN